MIKFLEPLKKIMNSEEAGLVKSLIEWLTSIIGLLILLGSITTTVVVNSGLVTEAIQSDNGLLTSILLVVVVIVGPILCLYLLYRVSRGNFRRRWSGASLLISAMLAILILGGYGIYKRAVPHSTTMILIVGFDGDEFTSDDER